MTIVNLSSKYGFSDVRSTRIAAVVVSVFTDADIEVDMGAIKRVVTQHAATTKTVQDAAALAIVVGKGMKLVDTMKMNDIKCVVSGWEGVNGKAAQLRAAQADEAYAVLVFGN